MAEGKCGRSRNTLTALDNALLAVLLPSLLFSISAHVSLTSLSLSCMSSRISSKFVAVFFPRVTLPLASHAVIVQSTLCNMSVASLTNFSRRLSCMRVPFRAVLGVD